MSVMERDDSDPFSLRGRFFNPSLTSCTDGNILQSAIISNTFSIADLKKKKFIRNVIENTELFFFLLVL
jgi:hypothetical protein